MVVNNVKANNKNNGNKKFSSRNSDLIIININDRYLGKYFDLCTI